MSRYLASVNNLSDLMEAWKKIQSQVPFDVIFYEIRCKYCDSKEISKYGRYKNMQQWWCKSCKRKFTDNRAPPGMKIPSNRIQSAISMYYKGIPIITIREQLKEDYNYYPSESSVHKWLYRDAEKKLACIKDHQPRVGNVWMVFESAIIIGSDKLWILDLIDLKTHFLLAALFSNGKNVEDLKSLVRYSTEKACKTPESLVLPGRFLKNSKIFPGTGINLLDADSSPRQTDFDFPDFWRGVIRIRRKIMRGQKLLPLAKTILNGWSYYYNYVVTQKSLKEKTASAEAQIDYYPESNLRVKEYRL
jgi:transposase-like protein